MPVRRRPGSSAGDRALPCVGVGFSLALVLGALLRPRGAQSFVVVPGAVVGGVIDSTAAAAVVPAAAVRSRGGVERWQRRPSVGRMGVGVVLRASMDDDDEFDPDAWTDELRENEGKTQGGDDMGMGVSNTVKKKRRADPKYA
ncbi:unnamed protein product, partial [Ectocarpus fasciculatus]